ncbi:ABC transporter substrate-binding protein [Tissierella praeacuta]|uniref:ABC transporter substrate-binding protein n=1 Tax=Tissierella praeacuta TaxID=43131 RepID=UPI003341C56C
MKIKKIGILALTLMLLVNILTGCSKKEEVAVEEALKEEVTKEESKELVICTAKELTNLTTLTMNKENNIACGLIYEPLVKYENDKIVPNLAKEWEWNDEGTVLTFKLQEGIKYHDGEDFNAESVKKALDFNHLNPNFSGIKAVAELEKVEVIDEYTVAITFPRPSLFYINDFCFQNVMSMMSPNVIEEGNYQTFTDVIGTGPYVRESFISGDSTVFVRNENYWGEKPYYEKIIVKYIPENSSRIQALNSGEVDLVYGADLITYDDFTQAISLKDIKGQVNENPTLTRNLILNASSETLSDINIRRAIAYGVNKKAIAEGLTLGNEKVAERLFRKGTPYTDVEIDEVYDYNVDKAKEYIEKSGWTLNESTNIYEKDGKKLSILYTYWTDLSLSNEIAQAVKADLGKIGIAVITEGKDQMTWWVDGVEGKYDITTWNTEGSYTEPNKFFTESMGADPHNISYQGLDNYEDIKGQIEEFSNTKDEERVKEIFKVLLNENNNNVVDLPISYAKDLVVYNGNKIKSYNFSSVPQFFDIFGVVPNN